MTTQFHNTEPTEPIEPTDGTSGPDPSRPKRDGTSSGDDRTTALTSAARTGVDAGALTSSRVPAMRASKTPVGAGPVTSFGLVIAVLVTAAGVVLARDALVYTQVIAGRAWVSTTAHAIDGVRPAAWMVPAGAALCLLGLWLLFTAIRPRPRKAVALTAETGVFLRPKDLARLAETTAEDVNGVLHARVNATRRHLTVRVDGTGDPGTGDRVRAVVTERLTPLQNPPTVRVRVEGDRT